LPIWTDFMDVALGEHPEWQGDWQKPEGVEEVAINPKTGGPAEADEADKRVELFINGTSPQTPSAEEVETEASPEADETPAPLDQVLPPSSIVEPAPSPSPRKPPRPELRTDENGRLEGTITLDIDPTTGLIAVETCPVIRTRTFVLGTEPKKYCGPEYHQRPSATPQSTRRSPANR
jgi:membrane carboxypeptidase/penicillin-binding protein